MAEQKDNKLYNIGKPDAVIKAHRERLSILKKAQEFAKKDKIPEAVQNYSYYLNILAQFHEVPEHQLAPKHFDKEKDIAELLLISHAYWDLAKAYDRSPTLGNESLRCLKQFVLFTHGYKFQFANALMVKKYIRLQMAHNPKAFKETYEKIRVESKGCYIATFCYGEEGTITNTLRNYRDQKLVYANFGPHFIHIYQFVSPKLIQLISKVPPLRWPTTYLFKLLIFLFMRAARLRVVS